MFKNKQICFVLWIILILDIPAKLNAIYEGHLARAGEYPFMVYITYKQNYHCGGAIIDRTHVITSGQCILVGSAHSDYKVISNTLTTTARRGTSSEVKYMWRHEDFHMIGNLAYNDYGIITVKTPFDPSLTPIEFAPPYHLPVSTIVCKLTGWGACTDRSQQCSRSLKYLNVPFTNQETCPEKTNQWWNLAAEHLCMDHSFPAGRGGASRGDLGSILSHDNKLVGFVTLPTIDLYPTRPDIYTKGGFGRTFFELMKIEEKKLDKGMPRVVHCNIAKQAVTSQQLQPQPESQSQPESEYVNCSLQDLVCRLVNKMMKAEAAPVGSEQTVSSQSTEAETGSKRPNTEPIHEISPKRYCVAPEKVQHNPEGYYQVEFQFRHTVAQQNNLQENDVNNLWCRRSSDNDDDFINFLLSTSSTNTPPNQHSVNQNVLPGYENTPENPIPSTSGISQQNKQPVDNSVDSDYSSGDEADPLNYRPRPQAPQPEFTPPNSP